MDMACIAKLKGWCGVAVSARPSRRPLRGLLRVRRQMVVRSSHVIASEAKQSILSVCREMDCFASLAMTAGYDFAISRHGSPEVCIFVCSLENRGRREDRVHAAPAVSCAKCANKNAHEHTGSAETLRPSLRSGFTAYFVLSPVNGSFATVIPKKLASRALDASTAGVKTTRLDV